MYAGATERIDADAKTGAAECIHIDDSAKVADVTAQEVKPMRRGRTQALLIPVRALHL